MKNRNKLTRQKKQNWKHRVINQNNILRQNKKLCKIKKN